MNLLAKAAALGESCRVSRGFMATLVAVHNSVTVNMQKELEGLVAAGVGGSFLRQITLSRLFVSRLIRWRNWLSGTSKNRDALSYVPHICFNCFFASK